MQIRKAKNSDLQALVHLLHDDELGQSRESADQASLSVYKDVLQELLESDYFDVFVMESEESIIGCYQMMYLPHLSFQGSKRAQVESVRIHADMRGQGLGTQLMEHAIEVARQAGCKIFQLTSNKQRTQANKFYRNLGFEPCHDGYKRYFE